MTQDECPNCECEDNIDYNSESSIYSVDEISYIGVCNDCGCEWKEYHEVKCPILIVLNVELPYQ